MIISGKHYANMGYENIFNYAREAETILIVNDGEGSIDKSFFYLSGARGGIFEGSALIVEPKSLKIITSKLEEEAARNTGYEVFIFNTRSEYQDLIRENLKSADTVGLNYNSITLKLYLDLLKIVPEKRFIDVSGSILESRRFKDPEELKKLREAAKIASDSFDAIVPKIKEGMTESELAAEMVYEMMRNGASGPSFSTIVAFGTNSSMPHYSPGNKKLRKNEFVLIDFGAEYDMYCSDMTRTVVFGKASAQQKEMYDIVREAQQKSMHAIRENVNGKDIDKIARDVIDATKYKGRFIHSLGHGIGMEVHDHPALSANYDFPLKANMVITDEPGVYVPNVGGVRIEDDVIVTKDGFEEITRPEKGLLEI